MRKTSLRRSYFNDEENIWVHWPARLKPLHSLVWHLNIGLLTTVRVKALMTAMNVHTRLAISALVRSCLTLIYICIKTHILIRNRIKWHKSNSPHEKLMNGWMKSGHDIENETQILTLAKTGPEELVAFWADTWEFTRLIYTLVLTKVTRKTALIYVWVKNKEDIRRWAKKYWKWKVVSNMLLKLHKRAVYLLHCVCLCVYHSPLQVNPSGPSS